MRLWDKVFPEPNTGCWLWAAAADAAGYGRLTKQGKTVLAHRHIMDAPAGHVVDHQCRVPACINPAHLEIVTQSVNVLRGDSPRLTGQINGDKTACPKGHPYDVVYATGYRGCRRCGNDKSRAYRSRRKAMNDG